MRKVGGCAEGGWGGDSLRRCEKEILPDRHRVRYNTTEPCFQCQAFRVCRFLLAIINGFYYAIHNPLHRLAGWLAGWRSCQQSQCLPPLFKPVTPCFQIFSDYANFHITMVPSRASEHTFKKKNVPRLETLLHRAETPGLVSNQSVHLIPQAFGTY